MEARPYRQKPTPEKFCAYCSAKLERKRFASGRLEDLGVFRRRKFCDQKCMAQDFDRRPVTSTPSWATAHWHARKAIHAIVCALCPRTEKLDVHHKDGNFRNNSPENLVALCRGCHLKVHQYHTASVD